MSQHKIPFNKPCLVGNEISYLHQALKKGILSGNGPFTHRCQRLLESLLRVPKVLLTHSGTGALEMMALLIDVKPGDEVIMPSFTFPSTANAFVLRGAVPRFVDIRPDTLNMDETKVEGLITKKTKAIVAVHYAGVPCEMKPLQKLAKRYGLVLLEDAAQALEARYQGKPAGTFGSMAALSFHETKNYICGEGGALVIRDKKYIHRAEILSEKGTNRNDFERKKVSKYTWVDIGSSTLPSEIQAAFLLAQLEKRRKIFNTRKRIFKAYWKSLKPWDQQGKLKIPFVPPHSTSSYHLFYVILKSRKDRDFVLKQLNKKGIQAIFHYVPLHVSPMGKKLGYQTGQLPFTEELASRLIRLPLHNKMTLTHVQSVVGALKKVCPK